MISYRKRGKRLCDLILAFPALIFLSPVLIFVALLVRFRLGSPVLFCQRRPGQHGRPFTLGKSRTMVDTWDAEGNPLPNVERLTSSSRFLCSTSLDEQPGLINMLKGEMSLVGPRPLLMRYLDRYTPEQIRHHEVRPGMTGWAQVNGRNALTGEVKFELDVRYPDQRSLGLDLKILLMTILSVLWRDAISEPGQATFREFVGGGS
jgi:lipopolysaccharide/colanic/teichoic acid biosynthesis glycosyltransferase